MSAANLLKPALSRGEIQVIGATTSDEYRKHIEKDSALERRFQPVLIEEPSIDETIEIIKGLKPKYEEHHKLKISDEAIESATKLSNKYMNRYYLFRCSGGGRCLTSAVMVVGCTSFIR